MTARDSHDAMPGEREVWEVGDLLVDVGRQRVTRGEAETRDPWAPMIAIDPWARLIRLVTPQMIEKPTAMQPYSPPSRMPDRMICSVSTGRAPR